MPVRRRVFDDIAKLATSTAGLLQGAGKEAENALRHRLEALLDRMDLVPRDEFEAVKEMAAKARTANSQLEKRIVALEARLAPAQKMSASKKSTIKKAAAKTKSATRKTAALKKS